MIFFQGYELWKFSRRVFKKKNIFHFCEIFLGTNLLFENKSKRTKSLMNFNILIRLLKKTEEKKEL